MARWVAMYVSWVTDRLRVQDPTIVGEKYFRPVSPRFAVFQSSAAKKAHQYHPV